MELSCFSRTRIQRIFKNRKERDSPHPLSTGPITEAFKEYINNEIPTRFIDTSRLRFVSRKDVFHVFQDEIASVTEEQITERMESVQSDPFASYQPRRDRMLRQIIQEIVKYDILSHRRDDAASEPSYQDVSSRKRHGSRSRKLDQFCETSSKLGRKLAWVDTCCIDTTNAAEVSEAINAMYKWYANSYLCIVYLAESMSLGDWDQESWFGRGWTLQELLAPKRLKFYDKNWRPFIPPGTDDDRKANGIRLRLEDITGISRTVLTADNSQGIHGHTFWEVMSWASRRQTSRIEDRAYSLLGLFYVTRSISYGEGIRAFSSLVMEVASKDPSWDVFAWCGKPSAEHFALPSSPASYPMFEADIGKDRDGVRDFTITAHGLSLKSLPPIPVEISSVLEPEGLGRPFCITLKPRSGEERSLGRYGNLVVECGMNRLRTMRRARRISACILNHHGARSQEKGKLVVGQDYICFLLYSEDGVDDETDAEAWMKLDTNNLLRMTCVGVPETVTEQGSTARPNTFNLSLTKILIQSPKRSSG
ncbi:hypothetical protein EV363DRAFT_1353791 [Boletus edulis]|nr:hypothetical protein EV363DRAFT_1353791 [Boletus edulis]